MSAFLTWELQKALVAALKADAGIKALVGNPARVFDQVNPAADLPYITQGDTFSTLGTTKDFDIQDHETTFVVSSDTGGRDEIKQIQAAINTALDGTTPILSEGTVICIQYMSSNDTIDDTLRYTGEITFRVVTQL